ncbi:hypothetical protein [Actinoplanes derwentensis]|uniref:Uncharacterized protein n=1 Tax=Actinoplanes derwentensis TaxID=113562 RepID=A0A1H2CW91_9ACTN|nr:hypothetical protein [Actinoplanes derwentensis]GID81990.1 hypothetical protein Ade03nite_09140 [Actinoplanes derwentensis]SDT74296.1 hypothetical protein SAMN04489716_6937 [Actinoplanes derwentensis]
MRDAVLAYGFAISNYDSEDATTLLLTAAHAQNMFTDASASGFLDDEANRDPDYQLGLLGLFNEDVGDGQPEQFVLASYLERTEKEPIAFLAELPLGAETANLRWAARILKVPDDEEPQWMLAWSGIG